LGVINDFSHGGAVRHKQKALANDQGEVARFLFCSLLCCPARGNGWRGLGGALLARRAAAWRCRRRTKFGLSMRAASNGSQSGKFGVSVTEAEMPPLRFILKSNVL
jgi:hypothetical protein